MKHFFIIAGLLSATSATAGGFEASRLDTNFMYEEGNYAELSYGSLDYDVKADTRTLRTTRLNENSVKSSQNRNTTAFKIHYGNLDIGLTRFKSGTIQLDGNGSLYGTNSAGCTSGAQTQCGLAGPVPETDVDLNTLGLIGKLSVSNEFDVLFGLKRNRVENSTVTTTRGTFTLSGSSNNVGMAGFAYSKPEIALRVELLMQPSSSTHYH